MAATYDPLYVRVIYGSLILHGFMDGTMITVERDEDTYTKHTGCDGEVARSRNRNQGGKVTLTLLQSSASNTDLSTMAALDEASNAGKAPLMVRDLLGNTLAAAGEAWIMKPATITYGKEIEGREWVLDCAQLEVFVGEALF